VDPYQPTPAGSKFRHRRAIVFWLSAPLVLGALVLSVAPYSLLLPRVPVSGTVVDEASNQSLPGARITSTSSAVTSGPDGRFAFERVSLADVLTVEAEGYLPTRLLAWPPTDLRVALTPRTFSVTVRDAETGDPVAGAAVAADEALAQPVAPGRFRVGPARGDTVVAVKATGYVESFVPWRGESDIEAKLQRRLVGRVTDAATGNGIPNAFLSFEGGTALADRDGSFELNGRPSGVMRVLAPGYRRADVDLNNDRSLLAVNLEPFAVKGLYLTFYGVGDRGLRGNALELAEKTEVNALVIDIKGDRGWLAYKSAVPLADKIGANEEHTIPNVDELLASLKQRGIYTIARIVAFKDDKLARNGAAAGVDVAIKDERTGGPWIDGEDLGWVDPFRPEVWDYNIALAREAAEKGFDEIQFDYIRFPTDPSRRTTIGAAQYSKPLNEANRVEALTTFLRKARQEIRQAGAFLGIDIFGYVTINNDDIGIGQQLEALAEVVDYLCPMVYPSTYSAGLPGIVGYPQVVSRPYEVIYESMKRARDRTEGRGAVLRPWLQYFDDYPWETRKAYNAAEITAQKKAAADAGSVGWMMWDPANKYARGGFDPKS
jgi:hypothetical protein